MRHDGQRRLRGRVAKLVAELVAAATATQPPTRDDLADLILHGLGARWCSVSSLSASAPPTVGEPCGKAVAVTHLGQPVGALEIGLGTLARLRPSTRRRIACVARVLGPVLHIVTVDEALRGQRKLVDELAGLLRGSRIEAVVAQDQERRALERNLHDGAQHHLVALRAAIGLLEHDLSVGHIDAASERVDYLVTMLDLTESGISGTATGTLPATLVRRGLLDAFADELYAEPAVELTADAKVRSRRYPLQVEVSVYYACLEAANNAAKHAPGANVRISLEHRYRGLEFEVRDDGPGFDPARIVPGSSLAILADRVAAVGGELSLRSAPGEGTAVSGFIPI